MLFFIRITFQTLKWLPTAEVIFNFFWILIFHFKLSIIAKLFYSPYIRNIIRHGEYKFVFYVNKHSKKWLFVNFLVRKSHILEFTEENIGSIGYRKIVQASLKLKKKGKGKWLISFFIVSLLDSQTYLGIFNCI